MRDHISVIKHTWLPYYHLRFLDFARDDCSIVVYLKDAVFFAEPMLVLMIKRRRRWSRFTNDSSKENRPPETVKVQSIFFQCKCNDTEKQRGINEPHCVVYQSFVVCLFVFSSHGKKALSKAFETQTDWQVSRIKLEIFCWFSHLNHVKVIELKLHRLTFFFLLLLRIRTEPQSKQSLSWYFA